MDDLTVKISQSEAEEALVRSGYLLESRLDLVLRRKGFYVEANTAYPDAATGKSRELDLYATNAHKAGPLELDLIFSVLLIECVNNPQPIAFISKSPQLSFIHSEEVKYAGLPVKVHAKESGPQWQPLHYYLKMHEYHHYCRGRVATQFCSFTKKRNSQEWMASHEQSHFDCLSKLPAVVEHCVDTNFKSWRPYGDETVNIEFYYPLVVVQGELLDVRQSRRGFSIHKVDHIQFRHSEIHMRKQTDYQIDVITEKYFTRYLSLVDREVSKTARLLRRRHRHIRQAIHAITRRAKRLKSPDKIRGELET